MIHKHHKKQFTYVLLFFVLCIPQALHAQLENVVFQPLLEGITLAGGGAEDYLKRVYIITISAAGLLATAKLVWAGIKYVTSGVVTEKQGAKDDIRNAIVGLLIILLAVALLRTINPGLANLPALEYAPDLGIPNYTSVTNPMVVNPGDSIEVDSPDRDQFIDGCAGNIRIMRTPGGDRLLCTDKDRYNPAYGEIVNMRDRYGLSCIANASPDMCIYKEYAEKSCVNGYMMWHREDHGICYEVEAGDQIDLTLLEDHLLHWKVDDLISEAEMEEYFEILVEDFIENCPGVGVESGNYAACDTAVVTPDPTTPTRIRHTECLSNGGSSWENGSMCGMTPTECSNFGGISVGSAIEASNKRECKQFLVEPDPSNFADPDRETCLSNNGGYTNTGKCHITPDNCAKISNTRHIKNTDYEKGGVCVLYAPTN